MLFVLRVRPLMGGPRDYLVRAADLAQAEQAEQVGRKWVETQPNLRFIYVEDAIVADASILPPEALRPPVRIGK